MNLTLYFRLICMSIFQPMLIAGKKDILGQSINYNNQFFYCPRVYAKDGFNISLQINNGSYSSSENGYRQFGHTWESVEFGFPSENEEMLKEYGENPEHLTSTVGSVPVSVLEEIFSKHGGIDWETTLSVDNFNKFLKIS